MKKLFKIFGIFLLILLLMGFYGAFSTGSSSSAQDTAAARLSETAQSETVRAETEYSETETKSETAAKPESKGETEAEAGTQALTAEDTAASESKEIPAAGTNAQEKKNSGELRIQFLDVGQGDSALVSCGGHYMLIDGGTSKNSSMIYSILKKKGIRDLDIMVASHPHADHVGGLSGALNYAHAGLILSPKAEAEDSDDEGFKDLVKYAAENGTGITVPSAGDKYSLGSAKVVILGVNSTAGQKDTDESSSDKVNDSSIVLKIIFGDNSFLFTGDAGHAAEQVLLDSGEDLSADVLKVGHHGSGHSTYQDFLRAVSPSYAVISVGAGNSYGHPAADVLEHLKDDNVKIFRTDLQGDISCSSDGSKITFDTEKDASESRLMTAGEKPADKSGASSAAYGSGKAVSGGAEQSGTASQAKVSYVLNKNTKKFHYKDCSAVSRISKKNIEYRTCTRQELIDEGYSPCGICHP